MFDSLITGGILVGEDGEVRRDIAIRDGRIAALPSTGEVVEAASVVDVGGAHVLPGLVDVHAHLREPGAPHKETFATGTRAAALGGVTSVLAMPNDPPWTDSVERLVEKVELVKGRLYVDVGFQAVLGRDGTEIERLAEAGAVSFELFTVDAPEAYRLGDADRLLQALRPHGGSSKLFGVSAGEQSIVDGMRARRKGVDAAAYAGIRPPEEEASGVAKAIVAAAATGTRVHLRQINSKAALQVFERFRDLADVTVETTPHNLLFTAKDYDRADGAFAAGIKASPPFREEADVCALRNALRTGVIDMVASDHAPHPAAEKQAGYTDFAEIPAGLPGLQTMLFVMLSLVKNGTISLCDLVRLCSTNPARRFGLGAKKGRIAVGLDADLVVLDPTGTTRIDTATQVSLAGYTPYDGLTVGWRLEHVFLRGRPIVGPGLDDAPPVGEVLRHLM